MRVSDSQRQRAIDELRRHCAAGRLDVDEYAVRIEQALAATDLEQLDPLLDDLPMLRIADPTGTDGRASRANGSRGLLREVRAAAGGGDEDDRQAARGVTTRMAASLVVVMSVIVVIGALIVALLASWTWAVVLIVGWLIGIVQGRVGRSPGR